MMYKINNAYSRNTSVGGNDIYRKFSQEFESLFNPDEIAKTDDEFLSVYVNDYEFENDLCSFFNSKVSMAKFCVGYTGIGKTTSIRYCLGLNTLNVPKLDFDKKNIIFPTFLDGYQIDEMERFDLTQRVANVCSKLEKEHPELRILMQTLDGKQQFFDFMDKHNGFALENNDPVESMDMSNEELIKSKLKEAYQADPFVYQANRLKFYIKKKANCYNRLIILLDDIETLPEEYQRKTIKDYLKLYDCMKNTDYDENDIYNVNLLISMRPHTRRLLRGDRDIEAYPLSNPISKKHAVDLSQLFEKRFNFYTKKYHPRNTVGNLESWDFCYQEVCKLNLSFDGKYKDMISNICFMNVRESLVAYAKIFSNRFWTQKNLPKHDNFTIHSNEYTFNNVNVIRALSCNEENVFWGDSYSLIPNIFFTTEYIDLSMYCLLSMQYFSKKRNGDDYGVNAERLFIIKDELYDIFEPEAAEQIIFCIGYLFENKILRKSINDFDDARTMDTRESLTDDSMLYISPRGNELLEMLSRDSILFELLREAAWRDYTNRDYSDLPSLELTKLKKNHELYVDLLDYVDFLCEKEDDILSKIKKQKKYEFRKAFGEVIMSQKILLGITRSLSYSDKDEAFEQIKRKYNQTKNKIFEVNKRLYE